MLVPLDSEFDQYQQRPLTQKLPVGTYVPPFLKITAKHIEQWAEPTKSRSLLPVLLRKLVNSTGQDLSLVDFPGYDQSQKKVARRFRRGVSA